MTSAISYLPHQSIERLHTDGEPLFVGADFARGPGMAAYALVHDDGHVEHLSDDDLGLVTVMAAAAPPEIDPSDEPALLRALHALRFPAGAVARLAPLVAAKARALRRAAIGSCDAGDIIGGLALLIAILTFSFLGCIFDAITAEAHALAAIPAAPPVAEEIDAIRAALWGLLAGLAILTVALARHKHLETEAETARLAEASDDAPHPPRAAQDRAAMNRDAILAEAERREAAEELRRRRRDDIAERMSRHGTR